MARGTYKTGKARNRRIPDPGGPSDPVVKTLAVELVEVAATVSLGSVGLTLYYTGTDVTFDPADLIYTGLPSTSRLVDVNGITYAPTLVGFMGGGNYGFNFNETLPIGAAIFTLGAQDPALRGPLGEWVGSGALLLDIK